MFDFESYLMEAINSYDNDPADTDYQRGYEAALREFHATFMAWERPATNDNEQLKLSLVVDNTDQQVDA